MQKLPLASAARTCLWSKGPQCCGQDVFHHWSSQRNRLHRGVFPHLLALFVCLLMCLFGLRVSCQCFRFGVASTLLEQFLGTRTLHYPGLTGLTTSLQFYLVPWLSSTSSAFKEFFWRPSWKPAFIIWIVRALMNPTHRRAMTKAGVPNSVGLSCYAYTGAVPQIHCSDGSLLTPQNVQGGDEQGFWCYLNSPHMQQQWPMCCFWISTLFYAERSSTHVPFPESAGRQFLWLKTATFMHLSPAASEFGWSLQGYALDLILLTVNLLQPKVF